MLIDEISTGKEEKIEQIFSIEVILNRLYFSLYDSQTTFWTHLGQAINQFISKHGSDHPDYLLVGQTIKECAIFLYIQWYLLSLERHIQLKQKLDK